MIQIHNGRRHSGNPDTFLLHNIYLSLILTLKSLFMFANFPILIPLRLLNLTQFLNLVLRIQTDLTKNQPKGTIPFGDFFRNNFYIEKPVLHKGQFIRIFLYRMEKSC